MQVVAADVDGRRRAAAAAGETCPVVRLDVQLGRMQRRPALIGRVSPPASPSPSFRFSHSRRRNNCALTRRQCRCLMTSGLPPGVFSGNSPKNIPQRSGVQLKDVRNRPYNKMPPQSLVNPPTSGSVKYSLHSVHLLSEKNYSTHYFSNVHQLVKPKLVKLISP